MKKSLITALGIAVVALLWMVTGFLLPGNDADTDEAAALSQTSKEKKDIVTVRIRELNAETMKAMIVTTGRTEASRTAHLSAETQGMVEEILAEKGKFIEKGTPIVRLELNDRKAKLFEAKERLSQRKIEYDAAKSLQTQGYNSRIRLAQAEADLESARADLEKAQIDLEKIEITAPFDGILHDINVDVGDYVSIGTQAAVLLDLDPVDMVVFLTERQRAEIKLDTPATAKLLDGRKVEGRVRYIAPSADPDTRTFRVEISADRPEMDISQGITAEIHIPGEERKAYKISPSILSLNDKGQIGVKLVDETNHIRFMPVHILSDMPNMMWVDGLPDHVRVVTVGQDFVVPGQSVKPVLAKGDGLL